MSKIKVMDELLANKIAAGEVVERCASVVKELVENSIDAASSEITIDLIEAGTTQIKVIDNGNGMDREDAVLAFERHATSKLKTEFDLFHIHTLGFRGEALASIASVSQIELQTCSEAIGTLVKIEGGILKEVNDAQSRKGTSITISNLFYNTPARLKHMKSLYTELASITDYVNKISLSHPNIRFILTNNNTILLNTDGSNQLLKTIKSIFGIEVAKKMIEVEANDDDYNIKGYISLPEVHRSNRNNLIILVNGRVVRNAEVNRIINDSYHSYKPDNRFPIIVLNIEVDSSLIDVNIHPTKMDIKFSKIDGLLILIEKMIKTKLKNINLIPKIEIPVISTNIEKEKYEEQILNFDEIKEEVPIYTKYNNEEIDFVLETKGTIEQLFNFEKHKTESSNMPQMYPIGLVHGTYIICQNELGMYLVDQHAAKERINYEFYKTKLGNPNNSSIKLLIPLVIELSNKEFIIMKEKMTSLKKLNFEVEEFGVNSIVIKSHPTWLPKDFEEKAINKIVESIINFDTDFSIEKFNENIATMMSCKLAIKANQNITIEEMTHLINELRTCQNPFNCPHGRPTIIFYSKLDLEKLFKRSGF
ncbi:MAG: DNA mismatch repair endonuclease MutL [Bacilli bacterium]